mgnify:FL=1
MKKIVGLVFLLIFSLSSYAASLSKEHEDKVRGIFNYMRKTTHTSLKTKKLSMDFYKIDNPNYFMESNFHIFPRLFLLKKKYRIGVNPLIFKENIPRDALLGVMAHELIHTEDYENRTVIGVGLKLLNKKSKRRYERSTDLRVVFKGLGHHLIQYKIWQYSLLTPEALIIKKKEYLTPEEINFVRDALEKLTLDEKELLKKKWIKKTPLNLNEFKKSYSIFLEDLF